MDYRTVIGLRLWNLPIYSTIILKNKDQANFYCSWGILKFLIIKKKKNKFYTNFEKKNNCNLWHVFYAVNLFFIV